MAMIDLAAKRFHEARDKLRRAIHSQKKALAASPRHPTYRQFLRNHLINLINAAKGLGNDGEARAAQRELEELAASDPARIAIDARLAAVTRGEPPKDNRERLQLAGRAYEKQLHATSARLYGAVLQADPKLAGDRQAQHRYNAACAAALAAAAATTTPTLPSPIKGEEKKDSNAVKGVNRPERKNSSPLVGEDTGGGSKNHSPTPIAPSSATKPAHGSKPSSKTWSKLLESVGAQQRPAIAETLKHWQTRHRPRGRPGRGRAG